MTTSLGPKETASNTLDVVKLLKGSKVEAKDLAKNSPSGQKSSSSTQRTVSPVRLSREEIEKDWDVSQDPELLKVLNKAKMLGRQAPPSVPTITKPAVFDLVPAVVRRLRNPKAPVKWCTASLQRNLAGFGPSGGLQKNQRLQLENLMKKVMGVAYMPEDLTGKFTSLSQLNQREQTKYLENDVFRLTGDSWMKEPGTVQWEEGQGVFINNYSNFVLWVNLEDQLRLISFSKGQDLKYILLRLQKAVARIEEALKMVFSTKSCQQRGFSTKDSTFNHDRKGVFGTGFETTFTMDLPGFQRSERSELDKAKMELGLKIEPSRQGGSAFHVVLQQFPEDTEKDIVVRGVEAVDKLAFMDQELQSRMGIKLTL